VSYDYVARTFLLWAIGISISTLAIKQHFVADVLSGIVTAFISFHLAALFLRGKTSQRPIY
jgi:membrane-associated phospholipid phosphatase